VTGGQQHGAATTNWRRGTTAVTAARCRLALPEIGRGRLAGDDDGGTVGRKLLEQKDDWRARSGCGVGCSDDWVGEL